VYPVHVCTCSTRNLQVDFKRLPGKIDTVVPTVGGSYHGGLLGKEVDKHPQ
jgi:hypothetical protein